MLTIIVIVAETYNASHDLRSIPTGIEHM